MTTLDRPNTIHITLADGKQIVLTPARAFGECTAKLMGTILYYWIGMDIKYHEHKGGAEPIFAPPRRPGVEVILKGPNHFTVSQRNHHV